MSVRLVRNGARHYLIRDSRAWGIKMDAPKDLESFLNKTIEGWEFEEVIELTWSVLICYEELLRWPDELR